MGDKARRELEELYLGIPDDSVNLTFKDLAQVKQTTNAVPSEKIKNPEHINEAKTPKHGPPLIKLPSLDFNRGFQESRNHHRHPDVETMHASPMNHRYVDHKDYGSEHHDRILRISPERREEFRHAVECSMGFDNASVISMASKVHQRRRPGIPHSNICTVCSNYIYIFRHRCLVCGRVYCRGCVSVGMGEMTEGRKCIECLGRRFSQRYIRRAGRVGWCSRYPSAVKQAELKWAEKGPRRSGEQAYGGRSPMMSRPRSPITPTRAHLASGNATPSFVANSSTYSPYSTPIHHHLPL